jgi:Ion channel
MNGEAVNPPLVGQPARRPDVHLEIFIWGAAAVLLVAFLVACQSYAKNVPGPEWIYVSAVFGLPLLQVFVIIPVLRKNSEFGAKGALVLLPSLLVEILLWFAFTYREICKSLLGLAAGIGLWAALVLGLVVFIVTGLILGVGDGTGKKLKTLLKEQSFLVVCFFLTVFTFITLFLSLSLALHDQDLRLNQQTFALHAEDLGPFKENGNVDPSAIEARKEPQRPFKVLFTRGSATVEVLEGISNEDLIRLEDDPVQYRSALNARQLASLTAAILEQAEKDHVRVVLGGYSDDLPVNPTSGSYKSNFELSQARINQVMTALISRLETYPQREWRRNVEWLVLPSATGQGFLNGGGETPPEARLVVQVALLPSDGDRFSHAARPGGRDLTLLDYIYFGVYTITTTGYGDIKPVSVFSKFITIVANFFEIFLIVVFFNVLLSLLREEHGPPTAGGAAAAA